VPYWGILVTIYNEIPPPGESEALFGQAVRDPKQDNNQAQRN